MPIAAIALSICLLPLPRSSALHLRCGPSSAGAEFHCIRVAAPIFFLTQSVLEAILRQVVDFLLVLILKASADRPGNVKTHLLDRRSGKSRQKMKSAEVPLMVWSKGG